MAVTINADPTSREANSYVTVSMADTYFDQRLNSTTWTALSSDDKARALIEAARRIDSFRFHGVPIWYKQKMQWPRAPYCQQVSGTAGSGSTTTLVDTTLANVDLYEPNEWEFAGVRITDGTAEGYARLVIAFALSTGTLTLGTAFPSAIDSTSVYTLVQKVPDRIRDAQCELAVWIVDLGASRNTEIDPNIKSITVGDWSETYRDTVTDVILPDFVRNMLDEYISNIGRVVDSRMIV